MRAEDPELLDLAAAIADGSPIDWLSRGEGVRSMRILASVAAFHRSVLAEPTLAMVPAQTHLPSRIGRFRIARLIAQGGMGAVYEAEQDRPRRIVALKVIRPELASASTLRRFEREAEVLARLHHPGIAQIYDAGTADHGAGSQPFFVMELIRGEPLLRHAQTHHLDQRARVELLARVAEAVDHAHQRGVIHRDLKPANILVDESGQPKVLDFGVARATDPELQTTLRTDAGQILGTLSYMSPEQIAGDPGAVDARTDVYALGVILYELLTGQLPYELSLKTIPEVASVIRDQDPARMSSIDRALGGDIETIVMKALEKESLRRYASAGALAEDLRRYLARQPIAARQPSKLYQLRKFTRRRPELVGGLIAVFLTLSLGVIGTTLGLIRATRQRDLANASMVRAETSRKAAEHEAQRALRVNAFLQSLLASARPGPKGTGRDIKVADVLDLAAIDLASRFKDEPDLEMEARSTLGQTYLSLGLYKEAEANLKRARELVATCGPERKRDGLLITDRLAWTYSASRQDLEKGEELARSALTEARRDLGAIHPRTLSLMNTLAFNLILQWKLDEADSLLQELLPALREQPAESREIPLSAVLTRLATIRNLKGDDAGADALMRGVHAQPGSKEISTEDLTQRSSFAAAEILVNEGKLQEAEDVYRKALAQARRILGRDHFESLTIGTRLADLLRRMNKQSEAFALYKEWLDYSRSHVPWEDGTFARSWLLATVGYLAARADRIDVANASYAEAIAIQRRLQGDADFASQGWWRTWTMLVGLGIQDAWGSDALRTQVRRMIDDSLAAHPTKRFDADELHWDRMRYHLDRWNMGGLSATTEKGRGIVSEGGLSDLKAHPDVEPGLYRLRLDVPRTGEPPLAETAWMLVSDWRFDVYNALFTRGNEDAAWRQRLQGDPDERRATRNLSLAGWWDTGFGPAGKEYMFGLVATTTIDLPPGMYRFLLTTNDGGRLRVDDRMVIDSWKVRPHAETAAAEVVLTGGPHTVRVDYFQGSDVSVLWVRAEPLDVRRLPVD